MQEGVEITFKEQPIGTTSSSSSSSNSVRLVYQAPSSKKKIHSSSSSSPHHHQPPPPPLTLVKVREDALKLLQSRKDHNSELNTSSSVSKNVLRYAYNLHYLLY